VCNMPWPWAPAIWSRQNFAETRGLGCSSPPAGAKINGLPSMVAPDELDVHASHMMDDFRATTKPAIAIILCVGIVVATPDLLHCDSDNATVLVDGLQPIGQPDTTTARNLSKHRRFT